MKQFILLALEKRQFLSDLSMLLSDDIIVAVHQKVHKLSILLIDAMSKVPRHEVAVKSLSVSPLSLFAPLLLFVYTPASVVWRAISRLFESLLLSVTISVAPRSTRLSGSRRVSGLLWLPLDSDLAG